MPDFGFAVEVPPNCCAATFAPVLAVFAAVPPAPPAAACVPVACVPCLAFGSCCPPAAVSDWPTCNIIASCCFLVITVPGSPADTPAF